MPFEPKPARTENLEGLLLQIRNEGTQRAQREAEEILSAARQQATSILSATEAEAIRIVQQAEQRAKDLAEANRIAQEQAARDLVLAVRSELVALLELIIQDTSRETLSGAALQELILKASAAWLAGSAATGLEVQLNAQDQAQLADAFLDRLRQELQGGVELTVVPGLPGGFRVGSRGGAMFYDFTVPAVAEALAALLRPQFAQYLESLRKEANLE